jgi:polar amino acid transport system substrate-binding protein
MKRALLLIGALGWAGPLAAQHAVTLTTESYPPFTYRSTDGSYRGAATEQVEMVMREAGIPFTIEIMPWARAITLAETQPMHCTFSAARTAEREPRFKWVTPLNTDRNFLVRHSDSQIRLDTLEEAKAYTIGTHRADYTESLLRERGFQAIDLSADFDVTLRKLLERRIHLMPMSESVFLKLKSENVAIERVLLFSEQQLGLACNLRTPDDMIRRMQDRLDRLIRDGRQDAILKRYGVGPSRRD